MRARPFVLLAATFLLASCTDTVGGTAGPAAPPPNSRGVESGEPCALLTPEHATTLGYEEAGEFTPGEPSRLVPPSCTWMPADPLGDLYSLTVEFATGLRLPEYTDGAEPSDTVESGGLTWHRYLDPIGGEAVCLLATEVSETSFVTVVSSDFSDEEKACDAAKAAAPYVASQLPGGDPAPTPAPKPASPLASVDPCSLLRPEQAEQLGRRAGGEPIEGDDLLPPGCQWVAADGDRTRTTLVYVDSEHAPRKEGSEPEIIEVSGREWKLYRTDDGRCLGFLEVTEASYVKVRVTEPDLDIACDGVLDTIGPITANLPS